jgi:acyl carrier protein
MELKRDVEVKPQKIRQFITDNFLFGQQAQLSDSDSFLEKGIIDSTGMLELISFVEEQYGISISTEELIPENLDSIDRITRFLERKLRPGELTLEPVLESHGLQGGNEERGRAT